MHGWNSDESWALVSSPVTGYVLWSAADRAIRSTVAAPPLPESYVSPAFVGQELVLSNFSGGSFVWQVSKSGLVAPPARLGGFVSAFHRSRDGHHVVLEHRAGRTVVDGFVTVWRAGRGLPVMAADPLPQACRLVGEPLSESRWEALAPKVKFRPTCA